MDAVDLSPDRVHEAAPHSPDGGHLRCRLSLADDATSQSSAVVSSGRCSSMDIESGPVRSGPKMPTLPHQSGASGFRGVAHALGSQIANAVLTESKMVKTHSHRPISADFLSSSPTLSSAALPSRALAEDGGHEKAGSERENSSRELRSYVLVHNVAKRHNLGTIARSATAFGVSELILVGRKDFNAFGSHGASLHMQFRHFHTLAEAALYLKAKDVDICGVEIVDGATAVQKHPFTRSTAFVLGNEGTGLSKKEMDICSYFVYIPQCGSGTASLNVTVAASIVLHHFSVWAGFAERKREGQKFVVAERPVRRTPRNIVENPDVVKERHRHKADPAADDWLLCDGVEENELEEVTNGLEVAVVEFPTRKTAGLLSTLNSLYGN